MTRSLKPLVFRTKFHELLFGFLNYETIFFEMVLRMVTQLDQPVLLHLIHTNVDCLTVPLVGWLVALGLTAL